MSALVEAVRDLRFALRGLRRDWLFTLVAAAMLAIAIGLNVSTFAVWTTMVHGGFPLVERNDRLLYMQEDGPGRACCISYADFLDWRAQAQAFDDLAFVSGTEATLADEPGSRGTRARAVQVTSNAFQILGVTPARGRDFVADDEAAGATRVAILSHAFWDSRFGGRVDILNHTIYVNGEPTAVVGVMPERFAFPSEADLWLPLEHTPALLSREPSGYLAFGRLLSGATVDTARTEIRAIGSRLAAEYPATNRGVVPRVETHSEFFLGPDAGVIYGSVWMAAWLVLL
ncbi:MAG TPA: ABC transporter permease, partial [Gammaproteobacteria bacterium]|nr:ABC transporter permease [Gammaproteobacteria bacterium]